MKLSISLPDELVARMDAVIGEDVPRSRFVRRAVERELARTDSERKALAAAEAIVAQIEHYGESAVRTAEQALGQRPSGTANAPDPAPAEQPVSNPVVQAMRRSPPVAEQLARVEQPYRQHVPGPDVENVRSSSQAKRGVVPVPKVGNRER